MRPAVGDWRILSCENRFSRLVTADNSTKCFGRLVNSVGILCSSNHRIRDQGNMSYPRTLNVFILIFMAVWHIHSSAQPSHSVKNFPKQFELLPDSDVSWICSLTMASAVGSFLQSPERRSSGGSQKLLTAVSIMNIFSDEAGRLGLSASSQSRLQRWHEQNAGDKDVLDYCISAGSAKLAGLTPSQRQNELDRAIQDVLKFDKRAR